MRLPYPGIMASSAKPKAFNVFSKLNLPPAPNVIIPVRALSTSVIGATIRFTILKASPNKSIIGTKALPTSANIACNFSTVALNLSCIVVCSNLSANSSLPNALNSLALLFWTSCLNKISDNLSELNPSEAAKASC